MPMYTPAVIIPIGFPCLFSGKESLTKDTLIGAMTASPTATPILAPKSFPKEFAKPAKAVIKDHKKIPVPKTLVLVYRSTA